MSTKIAAPTDQSFESSFFALAYDKLQEKLYNLLPFLVGFEVVKKSDDGTKAIGVFGFQSNNKQTLFVPAFFVNGSVKDMDLFYSKDNEQFYPLNEDWAELFLKNDSTGMGEVSSQSKQDLVRSMPPTDFRNFVVPPRTGKTSFASVIDFVGESDNNVKKAFLGMMEHEKYGADYTEAVLRFYPLEKVAAALAPKKDMPATKQETKVEVVRSSEVDKAKGLPTEQKKDLMSKGYVILDKRAPAEKSKIGIFKFKEKFQNPDKSGFYTYLTLDGMMRYSLVLNRLLSLRLGFPTDDTIVVDLDSKDKGNAYSVCNNQVFVKDRIEVPDFKEVVKMMVDQSEGSPGYDATYILLDENLKGTAPFRISQNYKDATGVRRIKVETASTGYSGDIGGKGMNQYYKDPVQNKLLKNYNKDMTDMTLVFTKKNSQYLDFRNNMVYVPKGFKLLKLNFNTYNRGENGNNRPGGLACLDGSLSERSVHPFSIRSNGNEYHVNLAASKKKYKNTIEAKIGMVMDYGLDEQSGNELIDSLVPDITKEGTIKLGYMGDSSIPYQDEAPTTNQFGQPEYNGTPYQNTASTSDGYTGNPTQQGLGVKPDVDDNGVDGAIQQAIQLAGSGQKEIFDTQSIATLAKYVNPADKVVNYMPDFVTALDKLGRMLFLVYWETDKFKEMYGRDELPELIELLKNVFKNLGDLVIFMKRKFPDLSINSNQQSMETM